ncbi:MAG: hypothetical protein QOF81_1457 [Acidimicrobiaceae bacterium]|jgi:hypothetical protein|nr:hypothetical protein [Acidimicrobiaceae bacterium]
MTLWYQRSTLEGSLGADQLEQLAKPADQVLPRPGERLFEFQGLGRLPGTPGLGLLARHRS